MNDADKRMTSWSTFLGLVAFSGFSFYFAWTSGNLWFFLPCGGAAAAWALDVLYMKDLVHRLREEMKVTNEQVAAQARTEIEARVTAAIAGSLSTKSLSTKPTRH